MFASSDEFVSSSCMAAELVKLFSIPIRALSPSKDHIVVVVDDSVRSLLVARCLFPYIHYTCATCTKE